MYSRKQRWFIVLIHGLPIFLLVSSLFYYWFAVVDRFVIFLYGHLGATAFDAMTNGRYWMSGLVAGGIVMVLYTSAYAIIGKFYATAVPPLWWQVWLSASIPLAIVIPAIIMNVNQPPMPLGTTLRVTAVAILALALALPPATIVTRSFVQFGWLMLAGLGIMPSLLLLRVIELPQQGIISAEIAYPVGIISTIIGIGWSILLGWIYVRRQQAHWVIIQLFAASLQISYLLLPLTHYLLMTPPRYHYISSTQNFFATNLFLQITVLAIALLSCISVVALQKKWCTSYK